LMAGRSIRSHLPADERWLSVGELNGRLVAVVWTQRSDGIRITT